MDKQSIWSRIDKKDLARIFFTMLLAIIVFFLEWTNNNSKLLLIGFTGIGLLVGCLPIIIESWDDIRNRRMSMDLSMLIAIIAAAAIGQWTTSLIITIFVLIAEILEDLCLEQGEKSLSDLMSFLPHTVKVKQASNQLIEVAIDEVTPGTIVVISPGERIPVDGKVEAGFSSVDQARITGEAMPVEVTTGTYVYAGSVNGNGSLEICTDRVGKDSSYGQIITAVKEAQASQAPVQHLADKFAAFLVYTAIVGAIITWFITKNIYSAIDVIIVAGACGIAAGTPLAILASIARAARNGAFVKGGASIETLSNVDTVIFDKTGTLTIGIPRIISIEAEEMEKDEVLAFAASAEWYSEHPLGKAIVNEALRKKLKLTEPSSFENKPGMGVKTIISGHTVEVGNGTHLLLDQALENSQDTIVYVYLDNKLAGKIFLTDKLRDTAAAGVSALEKLGIRVLMLTGDRKKAAHSIAQSLGMNPKQVHAELMPEDKLAIIDTEKQQKHCVAMIGDGVNDAPALAKANVGIAMGSGTDIARESAKVVLVSSKITDVATLFLLARRTKKIITFNFVGTIVIDVIGMLLAAFGILTPILAALIHVISESVFILNSARLIPRTKKTNDFM